VKKLHDGRMVPHVTSADVKVHIDRFDVTIKLWGSFWGDLATVFQCLFEKEIADQIEHEIV
jgi:hypothetical protein